MKAILATIVFSFSLCFSPAIADESEAQRLAALDAYWAEVSRSVREGDFVAYKNTIHPEAVLVSGSQKTSYPLSQALARWEKEFDDTRDGSRTSNVTFRFSHRYGDATTAHEAGIFLYQFKQGDEPLKNEYVHFEALLVKKPDGWKIFMEYQKAPATKNEWDALEK